MIRSSFGENEVDCGPVERKGLGSHTLVEFFSASFAWSAEAALDAGRVGGARLETAGNRYGAAFVFPEWTRRFIVPWSVLGMRSGALIVAL